MRHFFAAYSLIVSCVNAAALYASNLILDRIRRAYLKANEVGS